MKMKLKKLQPKIVHPRDYKIVHYRVYKNFLHDLFREYLQFKLSTQDSPSEYGKLLRKTS